ncbi:MAG: hypothetical protein ABWZ74_09770 [Hyphomicrobiaceae bacterium]|jgi:hypothetical protein
MQDQAVSFQFQDSVQQERMTGARRAMLDAALKSAARHYSHEEYLELERDVAAGKVDVRLYEDGLVLMRVGA